MRVKSLVRYDDANYHIRMNVGDIMDMDKTWGEQMKAKNYVAELGTTEAIERIPVFLSYPRPHQKAQVTFINTMRKFILTKTNLNPKTLGVTDFYLGPPLQSIKNMMDECKGLIVVAFKQTKIIEGILKADSDIEVSSDKIKNCWITSPYCHVEPAMALQMNLPMFILREKGIIKDGVFYDGSIGSFISEIDLINSPTNYFQEATWEQLLAQFVAQVNDLVKPLSS